MKAIIFGASGQDGFYLRQLLERHDVETIAVSRSGDDIKGDVADWNFVENLIADRQPDYIFHFAANSTTRHEAVFDNHRAISTGAINVLEAAYRRSSQSKIFLSGSAVQFENDGTPIDEKTPFAPLSPYAVSRIHSVYAGRYYRSLGLKVYVGYFFNHDSPRRGAQHVNQKIAAHAKKIRAGGVEKLEIGDAAVRKEFNFAGDALEAVWRLINQTDVFEAVIGSGAAHSIEEWLELCFRRASADWREHVIIKKDFVPEYRVLVSNPALIRSLGWRPKLDIADLAELMMRE